MQSAVCLMFEGSSTTCNVTGEINYVSLERNKFDVHSMDCHEEFPLTFFAYSVPCHVSADR